MLKRLEGYTTLIGNVVLGLVLIANLTLDAGISEQEQQDLSTAIISIVTLVFNILNRFRTKGPIGKKVSQ